MGLAEIWAAIQGVTTDAHDRMTLLYATAAESGAQPIAQIGGGPGRGYYQIELGQGVTEAQANDPVQATRIFYNRWPVHACATEQGQLWQTDPDAAANNAARCAETNHGGGSYGPSQRAAQKSLWQQVTGGMSVPTNTQPTQPSNQDACIQLATQQFPPGQSATIDAARNAAIKQCLEASVNNSPTDAILNLVKGLFGNHALWIRVLLVVGGLAAVLMGAKGLAGIEGMPVPVPV